MPWQRTHVWPCPHCAYETPRFYADTRFEEYMRGALNKHIRVHHTCQYCGAVGMKGKTFQIHVQACLRKQERKLERHKKHEEGLKRAQELKAAREAMLLICLAGTEQAQDKAPTPIATLTDDVLQCVFKHCVGPALG